MADATPSPVHEDQNKKKAPNKKANTASKPSADEQAAETKRLIESGELNGAGRPKAEKTDNGNVIIRN